MQKVFEVLEALYHHNNVVLLGVSVNEIPFERCLKIREEDTRTKLLWCKKPLMQLIKEYSKLSLKVVHLEEVAHEQYLCDDHMQLLFR